MPFPITPGKRKMKMFLIKLKPLPTYIPIFFILLLESFSSLLRVVMSLWNYILLYDSSTSVTRPVSRDGRIW